MWYRDRQALQFIPILYIHAYVHPYMHLFIYFFFLIPMMDTKEFLFCFFLRRIDLNRVFVTIFLNFFVLATEG